MAPFFFLLSHSKNRLALSLILLISLLLATLFIPKQPIPLFSLPISTSQPSIPPSFPPLPSKDEKFIAARSATAKEVEAVEIRDAEKCDLYKGRWVRDEEGRYPLYAAGSCPYVDEGFGCRENGRRDEGYLKWRWKPDGCELPR